MFFEWLGREGAAIFNWWLLSLLAGVAAYPLFFRLMGGLPSRGYPLARAAGLMLVAFVHWLLNILGLLRNDNGSMVLAWFLVLGIGLVSYATWRDRVPFRAWLREHRGLILTTELLFGGLFFFWAFVRALNPNLTGTEKPMEMAFLSAIRRSATFPPHDPWMSGYAISYYHFGYIMAAMLAKLTDVSNGAAFNLMVAKLFALAGTGAFGVVYDLVRSRADHGGDKRRALAVGVLGTFFLVLMGNFGTTLVEVPYQAGLIPRGSAYLDMFDLKFRDADFQDCPPANSLDPVAWCQGRWWWWAYSRVVQDRSPNGAVHEIITETPIFSFILSDMHPHVLALPFTMLTIALGFNMVRLKRRPERWEMLLYAIWVGGMVFLNSWDLVYLAFFVGADALRRLHRNGTGWFTPDDWRGMLGFALSLAALTAVIYAPFFISFRSQAAGILPNVIWPTRFPQFFLMFAPFLLIIAAFLWAEVRRGGSTLNWSFARQAVLYALAVIIVVFIGLAVLAFNNEVLAETVYRQVNDLGTVILDVVRRRVFDGLLTQGVMVVIIFVALARLFAREPRTEHEAGQIITYSPATGYALLLIAAGTTLALVPEFAYLRDGFGTRINMIFKLWYQAWTLWSVACAYALWSVLSEVDLRPMLVGVQPALRRVYAGVAVFLVVAGAVFPAAGVTTRAFRDGGHLSGTNDVPLTLDGGPTLASGDDDYQAIQCLASVARNDTDVVAEATRVGLAYAWDYGRVSALTGIPTLLGWDNHQRQWRGNTFDAALNYQLPGGGVETRYDAIATLYNTTNWNEALNVISRYGITYIYLGPTERTGRNNDGTPLFSEDGLRKFEALPPLCQFGSVAVYSAESVKAQVTGQVSQTGG
jgi:YYY domain-containing protein